MQAEAGDDGVFYRRALERERGESGGEGFGRRSAWLSGGVAAAVAATAAAARLRGTRAAACMHEWNSPRLSLPRPLVS